MISKDNMMNVLLDVCPSFNPQWQAFVAHWQDDPAPDGLPLYLVLSDFARHLIAMLERGETQDFPAIFMAMERLHLEGDDYVQNAAIVGLLEDMQNGNLHNSTHPEQFRPFLGLESNRWWDELCRQWGPTTGGRTWTPPTE